MRRAPRAGLLPFYLKLYDERLPGRRRDFEPLIGQVAAGLEREGLTVLRAPICCVHAEFGRAVKRLAAQGADCVVTLHLAYSPSLEALEPLERVGLPIVICDTTMDYDFGFQAAPERIGFNHGIHGVQDLACVLRRHGVRFAIAAGHVSESDVLRRTAGLVRAAFAARCLRQANVLRIGKSFAGMGDFSVSTEVLLRKLGILVKQVAPKYMCEVFGMVRKEESEAEMAADRERYVVEASAEVHRRSVRAGLALRKFLEIEHSSAFSMDFLAFDGAPGMAQTVPFLEASKAMARGMGYAGEGDVLTAAFVGALNQAFGRTTFTEIFCPDWKGNALFLSHMGEINPEVAAERPVVCERSFPWTPAKPPAMLVCAPQPGPATLVNLAPGPRDSFRVIAARVEVLSGTPHPEMRRTIHGWVRPARAVPEFLEQYSRLGGTHHSALVLGEWMAETEAFAHFAGLEFASV